MFALGMVAIVCWLWSAALANDQACLECHADPDLKRESAPKKGTSAVTDAPPMSVFVDKALIDGSVHEGVACVECHAGATADHGEHLPPARCASCHEEEHQEYTTGLHGAALQAGVADAPTCGDCHGSHQILPASDPRSLVHPQRQPATCAACHADVDFIQRRPVSMGSPLKGYEQSTHFQTLKQGKGGAACSDCHEFHALRKPSDPQAAIYRTNIQRTCGRCHEKVQQVYEQSVHGKALAYGNTDSPTCVDCHGEHRIGEDGEHPPGSYAAHLSRTTCVRCHESERIVERYGLPAQRLTTYIDSYHGLANKSGSTVVANCASCHGVHDILPSKDPASSIHRDNLPRTCGKCHPGAGENFALGSIHVDADRGDRHSDDTGSVVIYYVRQFYLALILVTVLGMLGHNGLDFARNFAAPRLPHGTEYLRFNLSERVQHGTMALSFIALAYSGFALKFPEAWWAAPFTWLGGDDGRRLVHRLAALAMVLICIYHLGYLAFSRRGREQFVEMLPRWQDARDAWQMLRVYLGRSHDHPRFGRFGYVEKLEYWALVWGSVVMTLTGFLLWFENLALRFLPKWGLDVATAVHYYEAWLAVLAIIVWHFYWVIFNPKVYPMSTPGSWTNSAGGRSHERPELDRGGVAGAGCPGRGRAAGLYGLPRRPGAAAPDGVPVGDFGGRRCGGAGGFDPCRPPVRRLPCRGRSRTRGAPAGGGLRRLPPGGAGRVRRERTRRGACDGKPRRAHLCLLSRGTRRHLPRGPGLAGGRPQHPPDLRLLPRGGAPGQPLRPVHPPLRHLSGQLSRGGQPLRRSGGGQLRQLPRGTQYPALFRPSLHHPPRQPGQDLRRLSPRSRDRAGRGQDPRRGHPGEFQGHVLRPLLLPLLHWPAGAVFCGLHRRRCLRFSASEEQGMSEPRPGEEVERLTLNERLQHLALMLCVVVLMLTGLALRYADTWLGQSIIALEGGMAARGLLHRVASLALMLLWVYHAGYVVFTRRGHDQLMELMPGRQDLRDLGMVLRQNLGGRGESPRFGRFDFRQKFQYWAVALGVTAMVPTGLVLWFESQAMAALPKWVVDLARVVHSGEGLVIFLVLFLWHLYDTHLRPGVFPMDQSWLTGRITRKQWQERHAREYEAATRKGEEQAR